MNTKETPSNDVAIPGGVENHSTPGGSGNTIQQKLVSKSVLGGGDGGSGGLPPAASGEGEGRGSHAINGRLTIQKVHNGGLAP